MATWEELRRILDDKLQQQLALEREKLKTVGPYPVSADDIWKHNTIPSYQRAIKDISRSRAGNASAGSIPEFAKQLAVEILQDSNLMVDQTSAQFTKFCEATMRMYLEFAEQRVLLNDHARSFKPVSLPAPSTLAPMPPSSPRISEVVEKYCKEMVAGGNWTAKTESEYRGGYQTLVTIIQDIPVALVDYKAAQFFKETVMGLPSNMSKKPLYRGRPIKDILAMNIPKEELLSISKINTLLSRISSLFGWALKNGYTPTNPFSGLKIKEKVADHEKRDPFSATDLKALFSSPEYLTGKASHPYHYWLPLLGLFTGARIDELCQLHLEDFYQVDGLWVISINSNGDKKLKNLASARIIPLHTRLMALGLVDYISCLKKKGYARLFPELKKRRDGYSQDASKWFLRFRVRCGVTGKNKPFHSFRHTVIDCLKQKNVPKEIIAAIVGHRDESITTNTYGNPYGPAALAGTVENLIFPIDVSKWKM
ncbi:hypothetical protein GMST_10760 [Geomonas silvestris]|uniref:Tyr recombinase domain-containing protein n=2 Tax=Geomonas silvestris TaxID=2740184 RepID=A0A6V8MFI3_9BACT|nr:hypothetical protein GMST_10760 [Geomonas silvestris]